MNDPTHTYVDLEFINNTQNSNEAVAIDFKQTKSSNILDGSCEDYFASVVRFSLDSGNLPLIIPDVYTQADGKLETDGSIQTLYLVAIGEGLDYLSSVDYRSPVLFTPEISSDLQAMPQYYPKSLEDTYSNPYYHIHTAQGFLNMVNKALRSSFNTLVSHSSNSAFYDKVTAPQFFFNASSNKIELLYTNEYVYSQYNVINLFIKVSGSLYNLLSNFPAILTNNLYQGNTAVINYVLDIQPTLNRNSYSYSKNNTPAVTMNVLTEQSSSIVAWSPISRIQFCSTTVPVHQTLTGGAQYTTINEQSSIQANNTTSILTDFEFPLTTGLEYSQQILYYSPQSEYRLIDLSGTASIKSLNIQVFWVSKIGTRYEMKVKQRGQCTLKLMFRKKNFNGII